VTVFDVFVNGRRQCRAGVGADGVLTAIVNWVKLTGPAAVRARELDAPLEESRLQVGGLRRGTHRAWVEKDLVPGDRVTIVVARARSADPPARRSAASRPRPKPRAAFLNVDLDITSRAPLDTVARAFAPNAFALFVGAEGRHHTAHLELRRQPSSADAAIARFVALVRRLPPGARRGWDAARRREFNIGIQAAPEPARHEFRLALATLRDADSVGASIAVTVYGALTR